MSHLPFAPLTLSWMGPQFLPPVEVKGCPQVSAAKLCSLSCQPASAAPAAQAILLIPHPPGLHLPSGAPVLKTSEAPTLLLLPKSF